MPIVTTLHTILKEPTGYQRLIIQELGKISDRLVVMSHLGQQFLEDIYKIPSEKIVYIPWNSRCPLYGFSLLQGPVRCGGTQGNTHFWSAVSGKGIEYMIDALPEIIRTHPDVIYIVLGATHPHVRKQKGRNTGKACSSVCCKLGLQDHVLFHNRFVELQELCEYLRVADLYVTPYLNPTQIVSGTRVFSGSREGSAVLPTGMRRSCLQKVEGVWFHSGTLRLWRNRLMICWIMKLSETRFAGERTNTAARWSGHRWRRITCVCSGRSGRSVCTILVWRRWRSNLRLKTIVCLKLTCVIFA